jgi:gamma-glutamyl-gamma-aminobutyrate hydrolase PuuD
LGDGLRAVAWSPDGIIEALESTEHPWLVCVQFHPEDLVEAHAPSQRLFDAFVAACRARLDKKTLTSDGGYRVGAARAAS